MYNTFVRLSIFCCGGKVDFVQIFLLNPNFLLVHSCSIQISFSHTGIGIWRGWTTERNLHVSTLIFSPMWKFNVFSCSRQIDSFCVLWRNISNSYVIPQKASLWNFWVNTLLLFIRLLTLTDRWNFRQRNKYTCYGWARGTFFKLWFCVSSLFWREIGFCFTYYICT